VSGKDFGRPLRGSNTSRFFFFFSVGVSHRCRKEMLTDLSFGVAVPLREGLTKGFCFWRRLPAFFGVEVFAAGKVATAFVGEEAERARAAGGDLTGDWEDSEEEDDWEDGGLGSPFAAVAVDVNR